MIRRAVATLAAAVTLIGVAAAPVAAEYVGRHRAVAASESEAVPVFTSPAEAGHWRLAVRRTV